MTGENILHFKELPPLSLYVHIPWCIRKCPYCDFNSHGIKGDLPEKEYINALLKDFQQDLPYVQGRELTSIFIGGGTPSLFSASAYDELLQKLHNQITFSSNIEITLEANPGTFEQEKFKEYRKTGINRLSIGVQSFKSRHLKSLGRVHDEAEARRAAKIARKSGFENFNLDLMFGLPLQTREDALEDLKIASSLKPSHLSWYQLTIEPNTEFYNHPPPLPDEDIISDIQEAGLEYLDKQNYSRYEISAYSQAEYQSQHNLNYWEFGDYIGIGAGAHGKITNLEQQSVTRTKKSRQPKHYLDISTKINVESDTVKNQEIPLEFMMNAMRLCKGCKVSLFEERTGLSIVNIRDKLKSLEARSLLKQDKDTIAPTPKGLLFLNDLLSEFL